VDLLLLSVELFCWVLQLRRCRRKSIKNQHFWGNRISWAKNFR